MANPAHFASLLPLTLLLLVFGCSEQAREESTPSPSPTIEPTETSLPGPLRPRPTPGPTATPTGYGFSIEPGTGTCAEALLLKATGLPTGATVEFIIRGYFVEEDVTLGEGRAGTSGELTINVNASRMPYCVPGAEPLVSLRVNGVYDAGAIYDVDQLGTLVVEPAPIRCGEQMTIRGDGFPPGANVSFMQGQDVPMVHVFVHLGDAVADTAGRVTFTPTHWVCPRDATEAVFASTRSVDARWKAVIDYVP